MSVYVCVLVCVCLCMYVCMCVCVCVSEYLMNVLDDLGLEATDNIKTLVALLQAGPEQYSELAEQSPRRLANTVAALRCLKLTE